ncbi:hypothetical protein MUK42_27049 [Musa troglodytarum]|uniref:Uncharacterized protein n=1 Tax=Musa troglodytarum TaxID=320322 RepID=A0A9E7JYH3_9LILI|nr:hypothetical protein MUK42_27049 [Musa troglodytarum]
MGFDSVDHMGTERGGLYAKMDHGEMAGPRTKTTVAAAAAAASLSGGYGRSTAERFFVSTRLGSFCGRMRGIIRVFALVFFDPIGGQKLLI